MRKRERKKKKKKSVFLTWCRVLRSLLLVVVEARALRRLLFRAVPGAGRDVIAAATAI
eukprot:COSAG06_NODE_56721_length_283_cov_0.961957_1_plen_57_part_10